MKEEKQENKKNNKSKGKEENKQKAKKDIFRQFFELIQDGEGEENQKEISELISQHVNALINESTLKEYNVVFLYDDYSFIKNSHANKIYNAVTNFENKNNIFLILDSRGGSVEPAYLISKTCKKLSNEKFVVAVPRKAKSAASLICLGADEIHMGLMSELGPIDPQINGIPALGLSNALKVVAELANKYPGAADMFANYLKEKLFLPHLGYFERLCESSIQYAKRLLQGKKFSSGKNVDFLANHFVNHYKDHSFVIDSDEVTELLGENMVKLNTKEYQLANRIYQFFDFITVMIRFMRKKEFSFVGSINTGFDWKDLQEE